LTEKVWGDNFEILYTGTFKTRPDLVWKILQASITNKRIIVIPMEYGEAKIKNVVENVYGFQFVKSVVQNNYFIYMDNLPDEVIINVLHNY